MKLIKPFFLIFFIFLNIPLFPGKCYPKKSGPSIIQVNGKPQLRLTKEMKKALKSFDPDFVIWDLSDYVSVLQKPSIYHPSREMSSAVIGDFNGDKKLDVVLWGHNRKINLCLVLLSSKTREGYRVIKKFNSTELSSPHEDSNGTCGGGEECEKGLRTYLSYNPPNEKLGIINPILCHHESFSVSVEGTGGDSYCFRKGKFVSRSND